MPSRGSARLERRSGRSKVMKRCTCLGRGRCDGLPVMTFGRRFDSFTFCLGLLPDLMRFAPARTFAPQLQLFATEPQEVRELLETYISERRSVLEQIEAAWSRQARRPTAAEVDAWIATGRS